MQRCICIIFVFFALLVTGCDRTESLPAPSPVSRIQPEANSTESKSSPTPVATPKTTAQVTGPSSSAGASSTATIKKPSPSPTSSPLPTERPSPSPTSLPAPTEKPTAAPTNVPRPTSTQTKAQIQTFSVMPTEAEPGESVALSWGTTGDRVKICPTARYVFFGEEDCWEAPGAGMASFTIPKVASALQYIDFLLTLEANDGSAAQTSQVSVALKCERSWFFPSEPQAGICPLEPTRSSAAAQYFQFGRMIWIEQLGRYLIFNDRPLYEADVRKQVTVILDPLDVVRDTSGAVNPPDGLYAPESGFGLVWRGDVRNSPGYVESLGWALAPEFSYGALYQCDDAIPSGGRSWQTCYLSLPDGAVVVLHPLGGWHWLGEL